MNIPEAVAIGERFLQDQKVACQSLVCAEYTPKGTILLNDLTTEKNERDLCLLRKVNEDEEEGVSTNEAIIVIVDGSSKISRFL